MWAEKAGQKWKGNVEMPTVSWILLAIISRCLEEGEEDGSHGQAPFMPGQSPDAGLVRGFGFLSH